MRPPGGRVVTLIRHMHSYGFRPGTWAMLRCIVPGPERDCYLVEFADSIGELDPQLAAFHAEWPD
jgi:hypothetical protein